MAHIRRALPALRPTGHHHHHHHTHLAVLGEALQHVDKVGAIEGVAANAHAGGLPQPHGGRLVHRLVRQRAGTAHDADLADLVNVAYRERVGGWVGGWVWMGGALRGQLFSSSSGARKS